MALLGFDVYQLDLFILDNNNPKTLVILDQSTYLDTPEKPMYSIKLPGYSNGIVIPYTPNIISVLNSNILGLTNTPCLDNLADLPDGIYEITQMVCPYNELYKTIIYLRTTYLQCQYYKLLLEPNLKSPCITEQQIESQLIHIDILIQSAKSEAYSRNSIKAQEKYTAAMAAITQLQKVLNCNK